MEKFSIFYISSSTTLEASGYFLLGDGLQLQGGVGCFNGLLLHLTTTYVLRSLKEEGRNSSSIKSNILSTYKARIFIILVTSSSRNKVESRLFMRLFLI